MTNLIYPKHVRFKEGFEKVLLVEYQSLRPKAQLIAEDMALYCFNAGVEFIITDVMSDVAEDKRLKRVSDAHSEGRAFDFRINNWSKEFLDKFEKHFETIYVGWAAVSKETGKRNLIQYHNNGNGNHGHCQIQKGLR